MNRRRMAIVAGVAAVVAGAVAGIVLAVGSSGTPHWVMDDLGTLPGFPACLPAAINDSGVIVGSCDTGATPLVEHGFLWRAGTMIDLGPKLVPAPINDRGQVVGGGPKGAFLWQHGKTSWLGGGSRAAAINERGQIVGTHWPRGHAVLWEAGKAIDLGAGTEQATMINERGQIVDLRAGTGPGGVDGFVWKEGVVTDLGPFSLSSESMAINDRGQVVASGADGAFLWRNGKTTWFGGQLTDALAINDRGQILLEAEMGSDKRGDAYVWQKGKLTRLPHFGAHEATFAVTMNGSGQVIGSSLWSIGWPLPFVWQQGQKLTALPTLKAGSGPPYTNASVINDRGEIAGYGFVLVNGHTEQHVVLWTRRSS